MGNIRRVRPRNEYYELADHIRALIIGMSLSEPYSSHLNKGFLRTYVRTHHLHIVVWEIFVHLQMYEIYMLEIFSKANN